MYSTKRGFIYLSLFIVILSLSIPETEGRRLVLRGRRTITRHYYSAPVMPVWVLIVLIALAEIFVGVVFYFVLRQMILTKSYEPVNTYQAAPLEDISNN